MLALQISNTYQGAIVILKYHVYCKDASYNISSIKISIKQETQKIVYLIKVSCQFQQNTLLRT